MTGRRYPAWQDHVTGLHPSGIHRLNPGAINVCRISHSVLCERSRRQVPANTILCQIDVEPSSPTSGQRCTSIGRRLVFAGVCRRDLLWTSLSGRVSDRMSCYKRPGDYGEMRIPVSEGYDVMIFGFDLCIVYTLHQVNTGQSIISTGLRLGSSYSHIIELHYSNLFFKYVGP